MPFFTFNFSSDYGFFEGSYSIAEKGYHGEDRMSLKQFLVMGAIFVFLILLSVLLRNKKEKLITVYRILSFLMPVLEIGKIIFSTYYDIEHGDGFNWGGILPFYTCSMLFYFLPFVAFGKGRLRRFSMAFFTSIGLVAGLSNFIYLSAAGWYPLWTYGCLYSILFHSVIVFVGLSLLISGLYRPDFKTMYEGLIPVFAFSLLAIPVNYIVRTIPGNGFADYMLLIDCNGFVPALHGFFADHGLQFLFTLFVLFVGYPAAHALVVTLEIGLIRLLSLFGQNKQKKEKEKTATA
ncbi:MAG: YwaF family protein [Clostridia bacterium]|nr:YwaF family protein [Clostridia bacterium]